VARALGDGRRATGGDAAAALLCSPHLVPIGALAALDAAPAFLELEVDLLLLCWEREG
jgi:hypothetical protein